MLDAMALLMQELLTAQAALADPVAMIQQDQSRLFKLVGLSRYTPGLEILKTLECWITDLLCLYESSFCNQQDQQGLHPAETYFVSLWSLFPLQFIDHYKYDLFSHVFLPLCTSKVQQVDFPLLFNIFRQMHPAEFTFDAVRRLFIKRDVNPLALLQMCVQWPEESVTQFQAFIDLQLVKPSLVVVQHLKTAAPHMFSAEINRAVMCAAFQNSSDPMPIIHILAVDCNWISIDAYFQLLMCACQRVSNKNTGNHSDAFATWFIRIRCEYKSSLSFRQQGISFFSMCECVLSNVKNEGRMMRAVHLFIRVLPTVLKSVHIARVVTLFKAHRFDEVAHYLEAVQ